MHLFVISIEILEISISNSKNFLNERTNSFNFLLKYIRVDGVQNCRMTTMCNDMAESN